MSTLKTNNIEHLDATSPSIEVNAAGGIQVGGALTATTGTFSGNVSVAGVLSYEDVTNIDSVGIVTARDGIRIPSGSLGIGTESPAGTFQLGDSNSSNVIIAANTGIDINDGAINLYQATSNVNALPFIISTDVGGAETEKLRFTAGGRLGIGSSLEPGEFITLESSSTTSARIQAHGFICRNNWGSAAELGNGMASIANNTLMFATNSVERLRIDANGRIGQNGKNPSQHGNPNLLIWGNDPTVNLLSTGSTANTSFTGIKFGAAGGSTGDYTKAGIFVQRQDSYNDLDMLFCFRSTNDAVGVDTTDSKVRINSDGKVLVGGNNDFVRGDLQVITGGGGELNIGRFDTTVSQYNDIGHIFFSGNAQSSGHAVASIACYAAEDHFSNIKPTYLTFTTCGRATNPPAPSERLRIGPDGLLSQYGGQTNNSGGNGMSPGGHNLMSVSDSIEPSGNRTYTFEGLQSGWMSIRGGGYSSAGQSQFSIFHQLGGYMTATSTYNVTELVNWGSGVTIANTKNNSSYTIQLTNNSSLYTLGVSFSIEGNNGTIKVSANV